MTSPQPAPRASDTPRVVIVMPAYNAEKTLEDTFRRIPTDSYDEVIVVDDHPAPRRTPDRVAQEGHRLQEPPAVGAVTGVALGEALAHGEVLGGGQEATSSVGFRVGVVYGLGTLATAGRFLLHRWGVISSEKFRP